MPWSHNPEQLDGGGHADQRLFGGKNQEQFMYNQLKKQSDPTRDPAQGPKSMPKGPGQEGKAGKQDEEFIPKMFVSQAASQKLNAAEIKTGDIRVDINNSFGNSGLKTDQVPQENMVNQPKGINTHKNMSAGQAAKKHIEDEAFPEETAAMNEPFLEGTAKEDAVAGRAGGTEDLLDAEELNDMINPRIYIRGVRSDAFYLILSGKVMICSGNEGFFLEQGPFNFMGTDCLLNDNYIPDFSAKVIGKTRLLKITREDYRKALGHLKNSNRS